MTARQTAKMLSDLQWAILSEISDAVIVTDQDEHVIYWNGPAQRLYGIDAEHTLGRALKDSCPELSNIAKEVARQLFSRDAFEGRWSGEVTCATRGGDQRAVSWSVTALRTDAGAPTGLLWILRDVTAQKRLQFELGRCKELLVTAETSQPHAAPAVQPGGWQSPLEPARPDVVLWAEDDDNDAALLARAWQRADVHDQLVRVRDGGEGIRYLRGDGAYADRVQFPFPKLLLLDLNMPAASGLDVVEWIKSQPRFPDLPIVILTSSGCSHDVHEAARLGVKGYLVKPLDPTEWVFKVKTVTSQCR